MKIEIQDVKDRLLMLGYKAKPEDDLKIKYTIILIEKQIFNFCNISEIPENLKEYAIDRICGEFLNLLFSLNEIAVDNVDLSTAIKTISEGDTSVTFATGLTDVEKFISLINQLRDEKLGELVCYRKMKW